MRPARPRSQAPPVPGDAPATGTGAHAGGGDVDVSARGATVLQEVLRRGHLITAADLATMAAEEARAAGVVALVLYVVDFEQKLLVPVPAPDAAGRDPLSVNGTVAGRAFATSSSIPTEHSRGGRRLFVPLLDGADRLGVMELTFADDGAPLDRATLVLCERLAHVLALCIVSTSQYSDHFTRLRRRRPMTMAGELIWDLVPPAILATEDLVLAALLEPCYDNGGDAFDYAVDDGVLHFAVFDAMGHGLGAAGAAAFALAAYRRSRRAGEEPAATYAAIDAGLSEQYGHSRFVTALIARLDATTGRMSWISAGHPAPLLLRQGRLVKTLGVRPSPPLGMRLAEEPPTEGHESLEPGDMVLLYTDGLTESRRPDGDLFTVERLGGFIERQAAGEQPAPEILRRLREAIIERGEGALRDDASALLVEWRRGTQRVVVLDTV